MRRNKTLASIAIAALSLLVMRVQLAAQQVQEQKTKHHTYKPVDLGTFGGLTSKLSVDGPGARVLNNKGTVTGDAGSQSKIPSTAVVMERLRNQVRQRYHLSRGVGTTSGDIR